MEVNLLELLQEYDQYIADNKSISTSQLSLLLKELRKSKIRRPDIVLKWGPKVLSSENYIEVWNVREQICIAALELNDLVTAESTIQILDKQFPKSSRVGKLKGMLLEAQGHYTQALAEYDALIKEDCTNIFARKRKVAVYKAKHETSKMIQELNNILYHFPADHGSWLELAELFLISNDYEASAHCYEELILLDPRNAHYHCRLGEILYSSNSTDKILNARKHFTISLTMQNIHYNLRAISGLVLCCKHLKSVAGGSSTQDKKKTSSSSSEVAVKSANVLSEHELKVNEELLNWSEQEMSKFLSEKSNFTDVEKLKEILFA